MSTMASARVPSELFDQGSDALERIGSNVTELIVSAFRYVAEVGHLPEPSLGSPQVASQVSQEQLMDFQQKLQVSYIDINLPDAWDFKQELVRDRWAEYETLA